MKKEKTVYVCSKCNKQALRWAGKCPSCGEWNSLEETQASPKKAVAVGAKTSATARAPSSSARRIKDIESEKFRHISTSNNEFDRVLGGGLVPGGVILLAGAPGTGKSTLLLQVAHDVATTGKQVLIVSGEESSEQIALRAKRVGADSDNLLLASESDLSKVLGYIEQESPDFVIIDSVQSIASPELDGRMGEKAQVTEVSTLLTRTAKQLNLPMVIVGHENKDGNIAGPRVMEHLVDVVLHFEGDQESTLKFLRGVKNRYGAADEVGCFEHTGDGIKEVPDPSGLLLGQRDTPVSGIATAITLEGKRPLPIEVQALVAGSALPVPRKATSGLDTPRAIMIQAVVERHGRIQLSNKDVYLATIGGMRTREPSVDLATAIALISGARDIPTPTDFAAIGELTLAGEVRRVPGIDRRIDEAKRLGFKRIAIPKGNTTRSHNGQGVVILELSNVRDLVDLVAGME